jgi:predicted transposase YdaD
MRYRLPFSFHVITADLLKRPILSLATHPFSLISSLQSFSIIYIDKIAKPRTLSSSFKRILDKKKGSSPRT